MAPSLSHLSAITLSSSTSHHLHVNFRRRGSPLLFNISFMNGLWVVTKTLASRQREMRGKRKAISGLLINL
jgi:hypothetical protein